MDHYWHQKMGHVTKLTRKEVFDTIYLECKVKIEDNKVIEGGKRLSSTKLKILNEIYKQSGYTTCNPYCLKN
jgi:hypothetical protein